MKKLLSLALAIVMLAAFVPGALAETPLMTGVSVYLSTVTDSGIAAAQQLTFNLMDAETGLVLSSQAIPVGEGAAAYRRLDFVTAPYEVGRKFILHLAQGDATLEYNGQRGAWFELETYAWPQEDGTMLYNNSFYMTLRPAAKKQINLTIAGKNRGDVPLYPYPAGILIPASALEAVGINTTRQGDGSLRLTAGDRGLVLTPGSLFAYTNDRTFNLALEPQTINGVDCVPVADVAKIFDCPLRCSDNGRVMSLSIDLSPNAYSADEKRINAAGVSSDTDYLIWISKSEYMVRVFMGSQGRWKLLKSFQCAIGAPATPTVVGTFKYYANQDRWSYASYWCGPIMRFRSGGYAIHSTLRRYDGRDYDGRVGVAISHGCVRVRPENIQWMYDTVPLQTTVYITA